MGKRFRTLVPAKISTPKVDSLFKYLGTPPLEHENNTTVHTTE